MKTMELSAKTNNLTLSQTQIKPGYGRVFLASFYFIKIYLKTEPFFQVIVYNSLQKLK